MRPAWFSKPASVRPAHLAVEEDVPDHPSLAGDRVQRQQPDARQLDAVAVAVEAPEQLVAAADREDDAAAGRRLSHGVALRREVDGDESLLAVLTAADVEQVEITGVQAVADRNRRDVELRGRGRQRAARAPRCCPGPRRC